MLSENSARTVLSEAAISGLSRQILCAMCRDDDNGRYFTRAVIKTFGPCFVMPGKTDANGQMTDGLFSYAVLL